MEENLQEKAKPDSQDKNLFYLPYEEGLRALLDDRMQNVNRPAWAGHSELWYLYIKLQDQGSKLSWEEQTEEAETYFTTATALGILGYSNLPERRQYDFRGDLRERLELGYPDTFKVPDQGKKLLQVITSVLGVEYNPLQEEFSYATVLDQPEIEPPTEADYYNQTEKAIQWDNA